MCKEREKMGVKAILRALSLGNGEGGDSLIETGKLKRERGLERR